MIDVYVQVIVSVKCYVGVGGGVGGRHTSIRRDPVKHASVEDSMITDWLFASPRVLLELLRDRKGAPKNLRDKILPNFRVNFLVRLASKRLFYWVVLRQRRPATE